MLCQMQSECKKIYPKDLVEYTFFPYACKLKDVADYELHRECYVEKYICLQKNEKEIKVPCMVAIEQKKILIEYRTFNSYWKTIGNKICSAINKHRSQDERMTLRDVNQQMVNLKWAQMPTKVARINKDCVIEYKGKNIPIEHQRMISKRATAMDDAKIKYVFSKTDQLYHDKSCHLVAKIPYWDFEASEDVPENREKCQKCYRAMLIRNAIGTDIKHFAWYTRFFSRGKLSTSVLDSFLSQKQLVLQMLTINEMQVTCKEDTWIIVMEDKGTTCQYQLYHNNYYIKNRERIMKAGYHLQSNQPLNLMRILLYISNYDWRVHLDTLPDAVVVDGLEKGKRHWRDKWVALIIRIWSKLKKR